MSFPNYCSIFLPGVRSLFRPLKLIFYTAVMILQKCYLSYDYVISFLYSTLSVTSKIQIHFLHRTKFAAFIMAYQIQYDPHYLFPFIFKIAFTSCVSAFPLQGQNADIQNLKAMVHLASVSEVSIHGQVVPLL